MEIPFLDLKAQYQSIKEEIDKKVMEVIANQRFILGSEVECLEKEISSYCGTKYAVGVSSGSDALLASLMAMGVGNGDEVVTSPFTFFLLPQVRSPGLERSLFFVTSIRKALTSAPRGLLRFWRRDPQARKIPRSKALSRFIFTDNAPI